MTKFKHITQKFPLEGGQLFKFKLNSYKLPILYNFWFSYWGESCNRKREEMYMNNVKGEEAGKYVILKQPHHTIKNLIFVTSQMYFRKYIFT